MLIREEMYRKRWGRKKEKKEEPVVANGIYKRERENGKDFEFFFFEGKKRVIGQEGGDDESQECHIV